jgi:hypothetical protein
MNRFSKARIVLSLLGGVLAAATLLAQVEPAVVPNGSTVPNWTVPAYHPASAEGGLQIMTDISPGSTFVAMTPCRVFDTRNAVGPYGGPRLIANVTRNFDIDSGPCGPIPAGTIAYSMNFGAILPDGLGFVTIWPAGSAQPTVSSINTVPGEVLANAAIVPAGSGGAISVFPNTGMHLYGDINGYFTVGYNAGNGLLQVGNVSGGGVAVFANGANTNNSAGLYSFVGPGFADNTGCCGPTAIIAKGAFNAVAGVAKDRAVVGLLASSTGAFLAEGQLGKTFGSDTVGSAVNGINGASLTGADSAAVRADSAAGTGRVYGVRGYSASTNNAAAGVMGFASSGFPAANLAQRDDTGVMGVGAGGSVGVQAIVSDPGSSEALLASMYSTGGALLTQAFLGYDTTTAILATGNISKSGSVSFVEPHSTDPTKMVKYISLEGNEAGTYFRGRARFQNGIATIDVPEDFRIVTQPEGLSIQVTPIGEMASVAVATIGLDRIVVRGSRNVEFFYTVNGVRRGYGGFQPIMDMDKTFIPDSPDAVMPQAWDGEIRNRLIANGIYKPDGTVNTETARRLGWTERWEKERNIPARMPIEPPEGPQ